MADQFGLVDDIEPVQIPREQDIFGLVNDVPAETPVKTWGEVQTLISPHTTPQEQTRVKNAMAISATHDLDFEVAYDTEPEFTKKLNKPNLFDYAGKSFVAGVGDMYVNLANVFKWANIPTGRIGQDWEYYGKKMQNMYIPPDDKPFSYDKLLSPEFYATSVMRSVPSTLSLIPAALIGAELGIGAGTVMTGRALGAFTKLILGSIGAATLSRPLESAMEASGTYQQAIDSGMLEDEARRAANETFKGNMSLVGLDAAEFATAFMPMKFNTNILALRILSTLGKVGGVAAMEGAEERYQQIVQEMAVNPEAKISDFFTNNPNLNEATAIGAIFGVGLGGAGSVYTAFTDRVVNGFTPEMKVLFDSIVEDNKAEGLTSEEATKKALDEIASTPEGEKEIKESVEKIKEDAQDITSKAKTVPLGEKIPTELEPLFQEARKYDSAEEFANSQINAYHQSQSKEAFTDFIGKGEKGYKKASYSQAGEGFYFSTNKELVQNKYGKAGGQLIEAYLEMKNPLDLGEYDAMYFDGRKVNSGDIVVENFKREQNGQEQIPEPDIKLENISKKAKKWLLANGYDSVQGQKGIMWAAPEYVVFDKSQIKTKQQLIDIYNKAQTITPTPKAEDVTEADIVDEFDKIPKPDDGSIKRSGLPPSIPPIGIPLSEGGEENIDLSEHLLAQKKGSIKETLLKGADKMIGIISTRLKNIHPEIKDAVRRYVYETNKHTAIDNESAYGFVSKFSKLDDATKIELSKALLNSQKEIADTIAKQQGMLDETNQAREIFEATRNRAIEAGLDVGKIENYWARSIKDLEGLLNDLRKTEEYSAIDEVFRKEEKEKGTSLSDEEKAVLINQMLRGVPKDRISLTSTSHLKERKFKEIPDKYLKYYMPADQSLLSYIRNMNNAIETARFFGKGKGEKAKSDFNLEIITEDAIAKSIGDYVNGLKQKGQLKGSDEQSLRDILQAVIRPAKTSELVSLYKNLTYMQLLTQITPAITQIGDLAMSAEEAGYANVAKVLGKAITRKSTVTLEDLHIDANKIIEEFEGGVGVIPKLLKKALNVTGFTAIDRIGKETLVNAKLLELIEQAKESDTVLKDKLTRMFGNEDNAEQVIHDLIQGNKTDDILFLLWNALSDKQPITKLEVPEYYLTSGVGKIFYSLKTYQLKLLDIYRNDVWQEIRFGDKSKGYQRLITLTTALMLLGAGADEAKDFILGKETSFSDLLINNLLKIGGFSKYTIYQTRREGFGRGLVSQFAPPFGILDTGTQDIDELIRKGELEKGARFTQHIPVIGKMYYFWLGRGSEIKKGKYKP